MKHYIIITEGPHDLAVVRKLMKVQGWGKASFMILKMIMVMI